MSSDMFRQHVGHQCFIPASHLVHFLLLFMDLNLPQEQGSGELLHLNNRTRLMLAFDQYVDLKADVSEIFRR